MAKNALVSWVLRDSPWELDRASLVAGAWHKANGLLVLHHPGIRLKVGPELRLVKLG